MKKVVFRARFIHDLDRMHELLVREFDREALEYAIELLAGGKPLPPAFNDHALHSDWLGFREFHLTGDWLVIYRDRGDVLTFWRSGSHADLFKRA